MIIMKKSNKKYLINISLLLSGIILIVIGFCLKSNLRELNVILVIFGIIVFLFGFSDIEYNSEIENQNSSYINDIIMYRKGYTLELRLPKTSIEDRLFREYADDKMIKELDNYLKDNKSVKFFSDDYNYNENTVKKLIRKYFLRIINGIYILI